jgi:hypothetical protein
MAVAGLRQRAACSFYACPECSENAVRRMLRNMTKPWSVQSLLLSALTPDVFKPPLAVVKDAIWR